MLNTRPAPALYSLRTSSSVFVIMIGLLPLSGPPAGPPHLGQRRFEEVHLRRQDDGNGHTVQICRLVLPLLHAIDRCFDQQGMPGNNADLLDRPLRRQSCLENNGAAHSSSRREWWIGGWHHLDDLRLFHHSTYPSVLHRRRRYWTRRRGRRRRDSRRSVRP